jgi:hypothetical protein
MRERLFPYEKLGFSGNPFRVLTDDEWADIAVLPDDIQSVLESGAHLQIMGQMGRGKSTTLRGINRKLQRQGLRAEFEYIPQHHHRFKTTLSTIPDVFLLDEAQRLWWWERARLLGTIRQHDIRLMVSSHADLTMWFEWWRLPLTTISVETMSPDQLARALNQRLNFFRIGTDQTTSFTDDAVEWLESQFGSDRRAMERFLYEVFQSLQSPQSITADLLSLGWN